MSKDLINQRNHKPIKVPFDHTILVYMNQINSNFRPTSKIQNPCIEQNLKLTVWKQMLSVHYWRMENPSQQIVKKIRTNKIILSDPTSYHNNIYERIHVTFMSITLWESTEFWRSILLENSFCFTCHLNILLFLFSVLHIYTIWICFSFVYIQNLNILNMWILSLIRS